MLWEPKKTLRGREALKEQANDVLFRLAYNDYAVRPQREYHPRVRLATCCWRPWRL